MKLINAILNLLCEAFFEGTAPQADILETRLHTMKPERGCRRSRLYIAHKLSYVAAHAQLMFSSA